MRQQSQQYYRSRPAPDRPMQWFVLIISTLWIVSVVVGAPILYWFTRSGFWLLLLATLPVPLFIEWWIIRYLFPRK